MTSLKEDFIDLVKFLLRYHSRRLRQLGNHFENFKKLTVVILMHKRGALEKHVWHISMVGLTIVVFATSGVFGDNPIVASSFPGVNGQDPRLIETFDPNAQGVSLQSLIDFKTAISSKPRSEIVEYDIEVGETLSQVAGKFGVSTDTIKWANYITDVNSVKPGQKVKILPVSGVSYTVQSGDTLEGIAKKYTADSQAILDFPFNDIPDDFKLKTGQVLIVPDGQPPETKTPANKRLQPQYLARGPQSPAFTAPGGGSFIWPTISQGISQYFAWYHPGIDLPNNKLPQVVASDGGKVTVAGWPDNYGYGNRIMVDHGNGYVTLYAHLSNIYVTAGQKVTIGQVIGQMGSTGRSTGPHLHFEIRYKGIAVNPLAILK